MLSIFPLTSLESKIGTDDVAKWGLLLFITRMVCHADLLQAQLQTLALNLWNLAQKHGFGNTKYTVSISLGVLYFKMCMVLISQSE